MNRPVFTSLGLILATVAVFSGCLPTQPFYWGERGDLSQYLDAATEVKYADVHEPTLEEVSQSRPPLTLTDPEFREMWDLSLEDVVSIALQNSRVIRAGTSAPAVIAENGNVQAGQVDLTQGVAGNRPQFTILNPAIRETEAGFEGNFGRPDALQQLGGLQSQGTLEGQGVEAALSEFDAQVNSSFFWSKTDRPQNSRFAIAGQAFFPRFDEVDRGTYSTEISKKTAVGTQLHARHSIDYQNSNSPILALGSWFTASYELEARQPLMRGRGTQINRMPVIIARIGTDQEIARLESQIQNFLANVEVQYWNLYCAYRQLEAAKEGRDSALEAWRDVYALFKGGAQGYGLQEEAQARQQYFQFRAQVEEALRLLYSAESDLRWMMGLAATDGRLIRPVDEPSEAKLTYDWNAVLCEALARRPILREQKWEIKKKEMQVVYARNGLLPQVNATALYRWLGLGDDLINANRNGLNFPAVGSTAYDNLTEGDFHELSVGIEFAAPVGYRRELANLRNAQLKLAREKAFLEDLELDVSRHLTQAIRALDAQYYLAQSHLNRWTAAKVEVERRRELLKTVARVSSGELDRWLAAQQRKTQAQIDYYRALCEYNKLIAVIHHRKGSTLEYCGVQLGEGPWPKKAYWDAMGHARRRSAGYYLNYGWSRPRVISEDVDGGAVHLPAESGEIIYESPEFIVPPQPTPALLPEDAEYGAARPMPVNSNHVVLQSSVTSETNPAMADKQGAASVQTSASRPTGAGGFINILRPKSMISQASAESEAAHEEDE